MTASILLDEEPESPKPKLGCHMRTEHSEAGPQAYVLTAAMPASSAERPSAGSPHAGKP